MGLFGKDAAPIEVTEIYEPMVKSGKNIKEAATMPVEATGFKGQVENKTVTFPNMLGEEHPFDFRITEGVFKKFGFANGVINKYVDFIVGPGHYVTSEDERATQLIEDWMRDVNFDTLLRDWIKEALTKNGFLELGGKPDETVKGAKVLDAKYMYVDRDNKGVVTKYNQYKGGFDKFAKEKVIPFEPHQVAHLALNNIGDMAYGMGIVYPALNIINNLLQNERDLHMLMSRKANAPYHVKMGGVVGGKYFKPNPTTVASFGKDLEWLNNKHEWVTDGLTEIKVIDFGNIGEKFNEVLKYDTEMLLYAFQVPSVLMGTANINEGIAKVQMDAFERRVGSLQAEIEKVIEGKIFKRILNANGLDVHVEIVWGRPSNTERYLRLTNILPLMTSNTTSDTMTRMLEKEAIKILEMDEDEFDESVKAEDVEKKAIEDEERKREEARPNPIVPGQNAKSPQKPAKVNQSYVEEEIKGVTSVVDKHAHDFIIDNRGNGITRGTYPFKHVDHVHEIRDRIIKKMNDHKHTILSEGTEAYSEESCDCPHCADIAESGAKYNDIQEWLGFNYKDYTKQIEKFIKGYSYEQIAATNAIEEAAGKLTRPQIIEFKKVLGTGFKNGESIDTIVKKVNQKVGFKDLLKMEDGKIIYKNESPVLVRGAEHRAVAVVRSEVTRAANEGAMNHFKEGGITKIRWVSSIGARTCPQCESLNGEIYNIDEHPDIPLHPMCRCTVAPVTELS